MGKILDRKLFLSLERSSFYHHRYNVLNDGNHYATIYADNDDEAVQMFRDGDWIED